MVLTNKGFISQDDSVKNYVVYEYNNISKADLYKSVLLFIQKKYRSPKDVLNEVPNESISISGLQPDCIGIPWRSKIDQKFSGKYAVRYDMSYNFIVQFKENKIRIDAPFFECERVLTGGKKAMLITVGKKGFLSDNHYIFSEKDGSIKEPDAKFQLENFFNKIFMEIKDAPITAQKNDSEW